MKPVVITVLLVLARLIGSAQNSTLYPEYPREVYLPLTILEKPIPFTLYGIDVLANDSTSYLAGLANGKFTFRWENGNVMYEIDVYQGMVKDYCKSYYSNGEPFELSFIWNDSIPNQDYYAEKCDGESRFISLNGSYKTVRYYTDSVTIEVFSSISTIYPTYHGRYRAFWPNGRIAEISNYHQGKRVGYAFNFTDEGDFTSFDFYDSEGVLVSRGIFNTTTNSIETVSDVDHR